MTLTRSRLFRAPAGDSSGGYGLRLVEHFLDGAKSALDRQAHDVGIAQPGSPGKGANLVGHILRHPDRDHCRIRFLAMFRTHNRLIYKLYINVNKDLAISFVGRINAGVKYRKDKQSKPIPVLLDRKLRERIEAVSEKMGEPKSTVMRIAMRIGLEGLDKAFQASPEKTLESMRYPERREEGVIVEETSNSPPKTSGKAEEIVEVIEKHYPSKPPRRK